MLKIDWLSAVLVGMIVSMIVEYWKNYLVPKKLENWINKSNYWKGFFFCWYCLMGKICLVLSFFIQPFMFIKVAPYPVWFTLQIVGNFLCLNFISILCYGVLCYAIDTIYVKEDKDSEVKK